MKILKLFLAICLHSSLSTASPIQECDDKQDARQTNPREGFLKQILSNTSYTDFSGCTQTKPGVEMKVGILGGGIGGLYAAMLLDSLGIDYDILEASNRTGGRIWTYRFDESAWAASTPSDPAYYDYFDIGAMRFPTMEYMDRVIGTDNRSIVSYVNANVKDPNDKINMIPYIFQADNTFRLFNDHLIHVQDDANATAFGVQFPPKGGTVLEPFASLSAEDVWSNLVTGLTNTLSTDFNAGFNLLMSYDGISVREFLRQSGYTDQMIDWLEAIDEATGHYDVYSVSSAVLDQWIFTASNINEWQAVNGGMDRLINGMVKIIKKSVTHNARVTAIRPASNGALTVTASGKDYTYAHIISTMTLGALQVVDLTALNLEYDRKQAIRKLNYDPAGKIGMKFKSRWWQELPNPFKGGQSFSDLPIRRCVYPSQGVNIPGAAGTMIASYTWGVDSMRIGGYLETAEARSHLVEITLRDLARMNNVTLEFLKDQYLDSFPWDWYGDEYALGGYAFFSPDQFSTIMPALMTPSNSGKMHFAGEALSSGHAWMIGAVTASYRTVLEILAVEKEDGLIKNLVSTWGTIKEVDLGWYTQFPPV